MTTTETPAPPSLLSQLRGFPREIWAIFLGTFINRFGTFVMPMLVLYLSRQGYSAERAGLALGAYGIGHLTAGLLGGHLADRFGRRHTIVLSMFSSAVAMVALSQARGYWTIVVLAVFAGVAAELYRPASYALLGDLLPPEQRAIGFSVYRTAVNLGFALGPATAGFLAETSFFYLFLGDAITSCAFGTVAIFLLPHGLRASREHESFLRGARLVLRDRAFLLFLLAASLTAMVEMQMASTFALQVRALGYPPSSYGLLISFNGLLIVLFEILITARVQRSAPRKVIAAGYIFNALGFTMLAFFHSLPLLAVAVATWTVGEMLFSPMTGAYVTAIAPKDYRGRYMGFLVLVWSFGLIFGPSVGSFVFQRNPQALWLGAGAIGVIAAAIAFLAPRRSELITETT